METKQNYFGEILLVLVLFYGIAFTSNAINVHDAMADEEKAISEGIATGQKMLETPQEKRLLNQVELAEYLGITLQEAQELGPMKVGDQLSESEIPVVIIKGKYYFSKVQVDKWLESPQGGYTVN
jgi:hypothetical protein